MAELRQDELPADEVCPFRVQCAILLDGLADIESNPCWPTGGFVAALAAELGVSVKALLAAAKS